MSPATKLFDTEVSVREGIVLALKDAGIDTVFGLPGGHTSVMGKAVCPAQRAPSTRRMRSTAEHKCRFIRA